MKKSLMVILLALAGTVAGIGSASAQCKIDDIYEKYRTNERFNSVNMSKEMLTLVAAQRKSEYFEEVVNNISSVKILSVKVPSSKKSNSFISISTSEDGTVNFDGEAFSASLNESLNQSLSSNNESATTVSKEKKEEIEKKVKEKMAQKEAQLKKRQEEKQAEQRRKQEEVKALMEQVIKDANSCIEASKYSELMSVNEDGKQVKYFAKMEAEKIKEFVVVTKSSREYSLIIIHGDDIKIQSVSRLGEIIPSADIDTEYLY